ncbi:coproporphyrinogen III oxidase and related Fe-S oxidoreductases [Candidatus Brocadia sinica JPN1]|uniref:Coproporphyrinogen III oxidase and related Fe-S oxidoreductases n=1 Tax=Candidatus Brocadia sinica JPN1 TaxID=1197129 RepID=A0ABQ0JTB0_9BACT|nr:coproporphyrinogen III oxidase and related Fe-S oxidoreductases [Candidatus Brocadia sinica JPN1]GIK12783.1 MAG: hypothetical protein BroJett002_14900 [Candidatus Brocadia sinica]GJQ17714.1 MAG: hypothetical protein HBSIN01_16730 [Candidatus Brocadia sinica]
MSFIFEAVKAEKGLWLLREGERKIGFTCGISISCDSAGAIEAVSNADIRPKKMLLETFMIYPFAI